MSVGINAPGIHPCEFFEPAPREVVERAFPPSERPAPCPTLLRPPRPGGLLHVLRAHGAGTEYWPARWGVQRHNHRGPYGEEVHFARAEALRRQHAFQNAWSAGQRCIVAVRGYHAMRPDSDGTERLHFVEDASAPFLALGGLWINTPPASRRPGGNCVLISITASLSRGVQRAVPLVIPAARMSQWLFDSVEKAWPLVQPYPHEQMAIRVVPDGHRIAAVS
jgi:putative SOS response-associated peptidase YedK